MRGGEQRPVRAARDIARGRLPIPVLVAWAACWAVLVYWPARSLRLLGLAALLCVSVPVAARSALGHHGPVRVALPAGAPWPHHRLPLSTPPRTAPARSLLRRALTHNLQGQLASPPSVSAAAIAHAFQAVGSPLVDPRPRRGGRTYAQYLWDRGQALGIDPAVVLALFWHESHYGTLGMAVLTHSLANNRPTGAGPVRCSSDGCYAYEPDWFAGIDTMYALLQQYRAWGLTTVDRLIPVWAPSTDANDVAAFIASAHQTLQMLAALSQTAPRP